MPPTFWALRPFCEVVDHVLSCSQGPVLIGYLSKHPAGVSHDVPGRQRKVEQLLIGVLSNQDLQKGLPQVITSD